MSTMASKMRDPKQSSNRKKKKEDISNETDDIIASDDMGQDHINGDVMENDPDPYEWEDDSNHHADPDDRRRQIRNKTEKQRKDKIRGWIGRISDLVPNCSDRLGSGKKQVKSMNFILEKCYEYIVTLREQNTALLTGKGDEAQAAEINRLKKELKEVTEERDTFAKLLKENKPRMDASKLWPDTLKINPEKVDLTKLIKTMRKPHSLAHVITGQESASDPLPKKKRKVNEFESEGEEIENRPPLIDCNGGSSHNIDVPMFSPGSDISNVTPVDIHIPEGDDMTSSKQSEVQGLFGAQSALQTLASVATTDMSGCEVTSRLPLEMDQSQNSIQPVANSSGTSVAQSLTMPIMSTSQQKTTQLAGTQLSGNIIMQNGQLIVLNDSLSSTETKKKSPEKSTKNNEDITSSELDQSQLIAQQSLLNNQQMNLGLPGQLPILNQSGMVPNPAGILPVNLGMQQQQQSNLPQALILPDGRIIPVVTQPNLMFPSQMNNVIVPGNQSQTLIGSGANLFMNQPGINSSQGQPLTTSSAGLQNLDPNIQPLLQQQILGQTPVGLPVTNYMVNSDGQVIQSVQPSLNQFSGVPGQILSQQTNLTTAKTANNQSKDLSQTSQNMQQVQVITSSGTVLTLQVPAGAAGQQIILDPNTLQPISQPTKMTAVSQVSSNAALTTTTTSSSSMSGKKSKKSQRVLMPKPTALLQPTPSLAPGGVPGANLVPLPHPPSDKEESAKKPKTKELTISQKLQALHASASSMDESTDILAKAAESIFSSDMSEFGEDKHESRDKKKRKKSCKRDKDPTSTLSGKDLAHLVISSSELPTSTAANALMAQSDNAETVLQPEIKIPEIPKKKAKKKLKAKENSKIDPNSLPDTITFDENDLSDVLDQVENISVPMEKSTDKKNKNKKMNEPEKKKRKLEKLELDPHDDVGDPGLQIVLDPPGSNSPGSDVIRTSPTKSQNKNESPQKSSTSIDQTMTSRSLDDAPDPFGTNFGHDDNRPTKDATLKAIDSDEAKESNNILDSISRIMDSPPPATPGGELEKENLLNDNPLSLLSSMAAADREHDKQDENASQKELFPELPSKSDDRQKDNFSPFNFADSPGNQFDMDKRLKDLSPTSSASAPLLRHSVEALFSSGKKDKDSTSMPGSILSQLNSPTMDLTIQEDKDDSNKTFPAQKLLPELDTNQKLKDSPVKERTAYFTSEGLAQPSSEPRKETMSAPSYFDPPASMKSVIQKADRKDTPNFYGSLNAEKAHDKVVSEFARNSPPPLSSNSFFNPSTQTSSAFSTPMTSSVAPFSFSLTSAANSAPSTTTVPSSGSIGSHHFPFYPLHPSLSTNTQNNDSMNLNLPFGESGRGPNAPPTFGMNNMNQSQPRYPNYSNMNQGNQFVEPQPMKGSMTNTRFPQPRRPNDMNQPRPYQDLNQFDQSRMVPRIPNQFDVRNQRPPETSQSPTVPSYTSPSMPGCEMGGVKNRTPDCNRPSSGEIRSRRQADQGSHIGTSPRMPDINQSPRMPEMNPSPRLADLNQSPRLSDINQSPRIDQSPGRADNPKRMNDIVPSQQQPRPRSGPGGQPMFYPQAFNPPNPMASPPLHHSNRDLEMRPNFGESTFNPPQDFNPVLNFGASGFDPPALELTSSGSTSTTQSQTFARSNQTLTQPSKARDRNAPAPSGAPPPKRPQPTPKPKSKPKAKKPNKPYEMDTNLSNSIFETGRSMTPYGVSFPISMPSPPPSRSDAPTYIGMPFGPSRPLSNTGLMQHKPSPEMNSFGPLFPGNRPQNGLGLNFQPGFGMNHMPHGNGPPPHPNNVSVTPHMPNFSLSNIFSDMGQGQSDLNISPIKFPHGTLPQPDHIQHHHQPGIYHQRAHAPMIPNAMSINSLLGHNHGFDGRPMGPGMGSPFHGPGTPGLGMPPFNFNVHDH